VIPTRKTNRIAVVADPPRFPNRPVLAMFVSCPLCGSWFNPSPLFNHEVHQRHETKPRNPVPIRGPRPGGPSDGSPARERWVPSPHRNPAPAGRQIPRCFTHRTAMPRSDGFLTPASLKTQRRQDRQGIASGVRPFPLRVFASSREPSQLWDEISREGTKRRFHLMFSRAPSSPELIFTPRR